MKKQAVGFKLINPKCQKSVVEIMVKKIKIYRKVLQNPNVFGIKNPIFSIIIKQRT